MAVSKLKAVAPKKIEAGKPKILVFGKAGIGKTWAALDFPSSYFIDTEGGADLPHYQDKLKASGGVYFGVEHGSQNFKEVIEQIKALVTEKHDRKTLVIDSFTKLYLLAKAEAAETGGDDYGRDKKEANKPTAQLIRWLGKLDMTVILICHEVAEWGLDAKKQRTEIGKTFDGYDKLDYEFHLALHIQKQGATRKAFVKKTRLTGFPDGSSLEWSYHEFATRYGKDVIERDTAPLVLATPKQIEEIKTLLEVIIMPEGYIGKCLKAASAEIMEEFSAAQADAIINAIKKRQGETNALSAKN